MKETIKLTETELTTLIKKLITEDMFNGKFRIGDRVQFIRAVEKDEGAKYWKDHGFDDAEVISRLPNGQYEIMSYKGHSLYVEPYMLRKLTPHKKKK